MQRLSVISLAALLVGCGGGADAPRPLNSTAFYPRQTIDPGPGVGPRSPVGPVDEAGRVDPIAHKTRPGDDVNGISDTVAAVPPAPPRVPPAKPLVWAPPPEGSTTAPSTPTTLPTGQYMIVGTVLADVDGTPIFANQVLSIIDKPLAAQARELDRNAFRQFAATQIKKAVDTEQSNELVYRAAERSLNEADRKLVDNLTTKWRQDEINAAGGSVEMARRRAKSEGRDFDQNIEDKHKWYMTQVYFEKKVIPLIVVTADMMREYYDRNKATLFTEKTAAKFRLIKIKVSDVGDRDRALARAKEWQDKLAYASAEEFAKFAHDYNTDINLKNNDGLPMQGMIDKGAFAIKPVEDAAWALRPGQVSDVVTVGDTYYIIRLEEKTVGRVKPFDTDEVQSQINRAMRSEQFRVLREKEEAKLRQNAIIRSDDKAMDLALEMAMQRYQQWRNEAQQ